MFADFFLFFSPFCLKAELTNRLSLVSPFRIFEDVLTAPTTKNRADALEPREAVVHVLEGFRAVRPGVGAVYQVHRDGGEAVQGGLGAGPSVQDPTKIPQVGRPCVMCSFSNSPAPMPTPAHGPPHPASGKRWLCVVGPKSPVESRFPLLSVMCLLHAQLHGQFTGNGVWQSIVTRYPDTKTPELLRLD